MMKYLHLIYNNCIQKVNGVQKKQGTGLYDCHLLSARRLHYYWYANEVTRRYDRFEVCVVYLCVRDCLEPIVAEATRRPRLPDLPLDGKSISLSANCIARLVTPCSFTVHWINSKEVPKPESATGFHYKYPSYGCTSHSYTRASAFGSP